MHLLYLPPSPPPPTRSSSLQFKPFTSKLWPVMYILEKILKFYFVKCWKIPSEYMRPCKSHGIHDVTDWMGFLRILKYIMSEKLVNFIPILTIMFLICLVRYMFNKSSWKVHNHNVARSKNPPPPHPFSSRVDKLVRILMNSWKIPFFSPLTYM